MFFKATAAIGYESTPEQKLPRFPEGGQRKAVLHVENLVEGFEDSRSFGRKVVIEVFCRSAEYQHSLEGKPGAVALVHTCTIDQYPW